MTNNKLWDLKVQNLQTKTEKNKYIHSIKTDLSFKIFVVIVSFIFYRNS